MHYGFEIFLDWCSWPEFFFFFLCHKKLPFYLASHSIFCHSNYLYVSCSRVKHQLLSSQIKVSRIQDVNSDFNVPGM